MTRWQGDKVRIGLPLHLVTLPSCHLVRFSCLLRQSTPPASTACAARFERLANPNPVLLMETWSDIMDDDNRLGILHGTDGNGNPMVQVSYRPVNAKGEKMKRGARLTVEQRLGQAPRTKRGRLPRSDRLPRASITTSPVHRIASSTGLPWPPEAVQSCDHQLSHPLRRNPPERVGSGGAWIDVISTKGVPFLRFHFNGAGRLVIRDLRGIRPEGIAKARKAARAWMVDQIRNPAP